MYRWTATDVLTKTPFSAANRGTNVVPTAMEALVAQSRAFKSHVYRVERSGSQWVIWLPPHQEERLYSASGRDIAGTLPPVDGWTALPAGKDPAPTCITHGVAAGIESSGSSGV
jgi:hypothetical protein